MKEKVTKQQSVTNAAMLQLRMSVLCTLLLLAAYAFAAPFYTQLLIFLFLLFMSRGVLKSGFEAMVSFKADSNSLVTICAFFALLHGISTLSVKNCFFYAALSVTLAEFHSDKEGIRTLPDKIAGASIAISAAVLAVSVIVNLVLKKDFFTVLNNSYLIFVFSCPCIISFSEKVFGILTQSECAKHGIRLKTLTAFESIGKTKEIIIEQNGIVTEKEYSLYDVYSTDGDKVKLLNVVAAIEQHFTHPYAEALTSAAKAVGSIYKSAENCFEICSKGVCATVEGDKYLIGNKRLLRDKKVNIPDVVSKIDLGIYMPLYVAKNGEFCGLLLLYSKMTYGAAEALDIIAESGIRRILLADGERADLKKHFDILLCEREKVLQEFKKGVKIKAMTVTAKKIANAETVALVSDSDEADICLAFPFMPSLLFSLLICRTSFAYFKAALIVSMLAAISFSVMAAFGIAFLPIAAALATALPLAFCFGIKKQNLPQFTVLEEELMFGKINYTMKINGMSCTHCSARVKTALESLRGVSAEVSLEEKTARIKCPASTTAEVLEKAVSDVGFTVVSTERV